MTRTVAIAGASGVVGSRLLQRLLNDDRVTRVVSYGRRPVRINNPKLDERMIGGAELDVPKDVEDAYCALGTTMKKAGSREAFLAVDRDLVLKFAKACRAAGARRFALVSAHGANPRSVVFYAQTKGQVEDAVVDVGYDATFLMRPGFIHDDGARADSRVGERVGIALAKTLGALAGAWKPVGADDIAKAMVKLAFSDRFGVFRVEPAEIATHAR